MSSREESLDRTGWPALLAEHARADGPRLLQVAKRILGDTASAEDARQTALTAALQQRREIDSGRLRGWLTIAVVNECLVMLRRRKQERAAVVSLTVTGPGEAGIVELTTSARERREAIGRALEQLQEDDRAVVVLRIMEERTGREVSAILGISDSQVSIRLHRGMENLRRITRDWADGWAGT